MKNRKRIYLIFAVFLLMMVFVAGCSQDSGNETKASIGLNDYITITASGYNKYGTASYDFDSVRLTDDLADSLDYRKVLKTEASNVTDKERADFLLTNNTITIETLPIIVSMSDCKVSNVIEAAGGEDSDSLNSPITSKIETYSKLTPADLFEALLHCSISKTENLSNGDIITVTLNNAETISEYFNCVFANDSVEYIVEGLRAIESYNPFDKISISYSGVNGQGVPEVHKSGDDAIEDVNFIIQPDSWLRNGNAVDVTAYVNNPDDFAKKYGKMITEDTNSYTVTGLNNYLSTFYQISESDLLGAVDDVRAILISSPAGYEEGNDVKIQDFNEMTYIGSYFLVNNNPDVVDDAENMLYLLFRGNVTYAWADNPDIPPQQYEYYTFIKYNDCEISDTGNLYLNPDKIFAPSSMLILGEGASDGQTFVYGYASVDDLYANCVISHADEYSCEVVLY